MHYIVHQTGAYVRWLITVWGWPRSLNKKGSSDLSFRFRVLYKPPEFSWKPLRWRGFRLFPRRLQYINDIGDVFTFAGNFFLPGSFTKFRCSVSWPLDDANFDKYFLPSTISCHNSHMQIYLGFRSFYFSFIYISYYSIFPQYRSKFYSSKSESGYMNSLSELQLCVVSANLYTFVRWVQNCFIYNRNR